MRELHPVAGITGSGNHGQNTIIRVYVLGMELTMPLTLRKSIYY